MGYLLNNCLFDRLSTAIINQCQPYKCSKDSNIDSFFHDGAKDNYADYDTEMMGFSHCFYTDAEHPQMVCAFSLSNTALRTAPLPKSERNKFNKVIPNAKRRSQYPAILIGQLCVFDGFGHHHVGDEMMDLIKTLAINPENTIAARYLVVDAVNTPKVISFYESNGFKFLFASDREEQECLHNIPQESIWRKIKRAVVGSNEPISKSRTRLMYFDLIVLNQ